MATAAATPKQFNGHDTFIRTNTHTFNKNFNNSSESFLLYFDKNNILVGKEEQEEKKIRLP